MSELGLCVAVLRGRNADDPDAPEPGAKMCLAPDAVADAISIGADVEQSVCGKPDGDCCPFHSTCAYQRQKAAVAAADVVIAAHNIMFHEIPKIVTKNLALTITDQILVADRVGVGPGNHDRWLRERPVREPGTA